MKTAQSLQQFKALTIDEQINVLYQHGTFIMAIRYYDYKVNLYLISSDFVEVFINHKHSRIERIEILDRSSNRMKFYTDQIKLPGY